MPFDRKDIDAAAGGNQALCRLLDRMASAQQKLYRVLGVTPEGAKAHAQPDKFAAPTPASFMITTSGGVIQIQITNPSEVLVPLLMHHIQSSTTLPFEASQTITDYGETTQNVVTILAANQTLYWRIRSRYPMGIPNGWTVFQGTPTGPILISGTPGTSGASGAVTGGAVNSSTPTLLLKNTTAQGRLNPTATASALTTIPATAVPAALASFRNEGTAGNWLICFGGLIPTATFYHVKLGPGDLSLNTMGEGFAEENPPTGIITAVHDSPGAGGAGVLHWYAGWNTNASPAVGPTGPAGVNGAYGGPITMDYLFDTGTSSADPGTGKFRLNNATQNTATALYVDITSNDSVALAGVLDNLTNSTNTTKSVIRLVKKNDPTKFLLFYITSETTHSGYREFAIAIIASSAASPFASLDECLLCVAQIGDVGNPWTLAVTESGGSFTNWTTVRGTTWASSGGAIQGTTAAAAFSETKYNTPTAQTALVFQADMSIASSGGFTGDTDAGLLINWDGTNGGNGFGCYINLKTTGHSPTTDGTVHTEQPNSQIAGPSVTFHFSFDTFYTLRVVAVGNVLDVYVDGVYQMTAYRVPYSSGAAPATVASFFGLRAGNCTANFKNIKFYNMTVP